MGDVSKVHELKTDSGPFQDVWTGDKKFEVRRDDRGFNVGDCLLLREFRNRRPTGRWLTRRVAYVLRDAEKYGLQPGYVVLGLAWNLYDPDNTS